MSEPRGARLDGPPMFAPHHAPYGDFIYLTSKHNAAHKALIHLGATVRYFRSGALYTWGMPAHGAHILSGHGIVDGRYFVGPQPLRATPGRLTGPCFAISMSDSVTVVTDEFGVLPVYYSNTLITNRLHLAAVVVGEVNYGPIFSTFHSNHMFCQQLNCLSTPVAGVNLSRPGDRFTAGESIKSTSWTSDVDYHSVGDTSEYWKLIEQGAEEVAQNVSGIVESKHQVVSDLTGGQDSRVLFAALVATGRVQDVLFHTKVRSRGEVNMTRTSASAAAYESAQADVDIATSLVGHHGGKFNVTSAPSADSAAYQYTTFETNIEGRRSQVFGTYHFVTPNVTRTMWRVSSPIIRMMGGGGEIYRDYYQAFFRTKVGSEVYSEDLTRSVLASTRNKTLSWDAIWRRTEQELVETFNYLPGSTFDQKLDSHYLFFRNRYHFGLTKSLPGSGLNINPIMSKSLFLAARLLPPAEKAAGRVLFDVTRHLAEEVAYHTYTKFDASAVAESPFHRRSTKARCDALPLRPRRDLLHVDRKPTGTKPRHPSGSGPDLLAFANQASASIIEHLRNNSPDSSAGVIASTLTKDFITDYHSVPTRALSWYSRLQGLHDVISVATSCSAARKIE